MLLFHILKFELTEELRTFKSSVLKQKKQFNSKCAATAEGAQKGPHPSGARQISHVILWSARPPCYSPFSVVLILDCVFDTAAMSSVGNCREMRTLHLYRHEMQHFVRMIQEYASNQVINVTWHEFQQNLANVGTLDDLHRCHGDYLNKCISRLVLLNDITFVSSFRAVSEPSFEN